MADSDIAATNVAFVLKLCANIYFIALFSLYRVVSRFYLPSYCPIVNIDYKLNSF